MPAEREKLTFRGATIVYNDWLDARDEIVEPDGTVRDIDAEPSPFWRNHQPDPDPDTNTQEQPR